jgi:hypothetical protein
MAQYRKRPVVIDAWQISPDSTLEELERLAEMCNGGIGWGAGAKPTGILIETLEGIMRADLGDWIVKGVSGEFYPVKPNIFDVTYEAVDTEAI